MKILQRKTHSIALVDSFHEIFMWHLIAHVIQQLKSYRYRKVLGSNMKRCFSKLLKSLSLSKKCWIFKAQEKKFNKK